MASKSKNKKPSKQARRGTTEKKLTTHGARPVGTSPDRGFKRPSGNGG